MTYIAATDLLARFGAEELAQLTDRGIPRVLTADRLTAAAGGADTSAWPAAESAAALAALSIIGQAITDATSAVDGYLSGRYGVPLTTPPAVLKRVACDLARHYLYDDNEPETVADRYKEAVAWLRDVAAGKVALGPDAAGAQPAAGGCVEIVTSGKVFGRRERGL